MKKVTLLGSKCALFLLVIFFSQASYSQFSLGPMDGGFTVAPSNFLGDLGGTYGKGRGFLKDNNVSLTKVIVGAHLTANPTDYLSFRLALNYGGITGDDAVIQAKGGLEEARKARNQNFKSKIMEGFLAMELYPTVFFEEDPSDSYHKIRPYGLAGIGVFHFNSMGKDPATGNWIYLKPLHLEGQGFPEYPDRKEYKLTQANIPLGVGLKYFASDNVSVSLEIIHRKTFTDYIDNVSKDYIDKDLFYQHLPLATAVVAERMYDKSVNSANRNIGDKRGTPTNMDGYYSAGIKFSFRLGSNNGYGNSTRCPVMRF